ncbi:peptide ligase PGM1-related protein [Knoellia locipacati]|uniref:peptide ligase PGM1-related protein n=1 Tax=Knoellia locipacati TaxID=882824 RepID=UPI003850A021
MSIDDRLRSSEPQLLSDLDEAGRNAAFDRLQARLPDVWRSMRLNEADESVVVVPSVSLDRVNAKFGAVNQAMEERYLFLLLLLRQPRLRMVYVTSGPVDPAIVEYYLALLPGVIPSHAWSRLTMVSVGDLTPRPLSEKLLERPRLLADIAALIPNPKRSHLVPYTTTTLERDLAIELGIPMYGADPRHLALGTKSGCRKLFDESGVSYPVGFEDLSLLDDIVDALARLRERRQDASVAMVKLNEGVSGAGNAVVDLAGLPAPGAPDERSALLERVRVMELEGRSVTHETYFAKFEQKGGIVEERIVGDEVLSPSVQLRVTPLGELEVLSTHDQILGGATGQSYLGCTFPAAAGYASLITREAEAIGRRLAELGVLGRFAVDFVVVRHGTAWTAHAIEVNLRKGGTTHPFLTLQFLTNGRYHGDTGLFTTPMGREKHLMATDHLEDPSLRGLRVGDLFDIVARTGLHFDPARESGVVFHMISSVTEAGRVGMTAVGDTAAHAREVYDRAERILLAEAREAVSPRPVRA